MNWTHISSAVDSRSYPGIETTSSCRTFCCRRSAGVSVHLASAGVTRLVQSLPLAFTREFVKLVLVVINDLG